MNEFSKNTGNHTTVQPVEEAVQTVVKEVKEVKVKIKEPFDVVSGAEGKLKQKLNNLYNEKGDFDIIQFARNMNQNVAIIRYK